VNADALKQLIRDVPDFPKPGILFRDVTPLFARPEALHAAVDAVAAPFRTGQEDGGAAVDRVLGIEARGFVLGAPVAMALGAGFGLVRKAGRLPWKTHQVSYALEYGEDAIEMHVDTVAAGQRVLVVDDLVATGGTAAAAVRLVRDAGAEVVGCAFLVELQDLGGAERLADVPRVHSVIRY